MRCCVIIMGCKVNPGLRNMEAIHNSYMTLYNENKKDFVNEYEFYFYDGSNEDFSVEKYKKYANIVHCVSGDDIHNTYQKSLECYKWIVNDKEFDWVVRVNISTYVNMYMLDNFLNYANKDKIYANQFCAYLYNWHYLNDCFPRGDAHIVSFDVLKKAIKQSDFLDIDKIKGNTDKVDDVLMGLLYMKSFDDLYINHYEIINYTFLPQEVNIILSNPDDVIIKNSFYTIFTRLKTCPTNAQSGYSWEDNEYRKQDIFKFDIVNNIIKNNKSLYFSNKIKEKLYEIVLEKANDSYLVPYLNLNKSSLDGIDFIELKNLIKDKYSESIIY